MRKFLHLFFGIQLTLFSHVLFAQTTPEPNSTTDLQKQAVQQAYEDWAYALTTARGNPQSIVGFYAPNAILLATLSPVIKSNLHSSLSDELFAFTSVDLRQYFIELTKLKGLQVSLHKIYTQIFENVAVNTGLYTFTYANEQDQTIKVPARFTFVYELIDGKWLIINHHSSILPEMSL